MTPKWSGLWLFLFVLAGVGKITLAQDPVSEDPPLKRIYLPTDDLDIAMGKVKSGVLLPQQEFENLHRLAKQNAARQPNQPRGIVVSQVLYDAELTETQLLVKATVSLHQFGAGWQKLPLPFNRLHVESAVIDDQPAPLGFEGTLWLLNRDEGKHTLTLQLSTPLESDGSDRVAAWELIPCASALFRMTVPAEKYLRVEFQPVDFRTGQQQEWQRPAPAGEPAHYEIPVGDKEFIGIRITDQQGQQSTESLVFATSSVGLSAAAGEVTWQAVTNLQVFGSSLDQLTFRIPKSLEIADVQSTGLETWELNDTADGKGIEIKLSYRQSIEDQRKITFRGVMTVPPDQSWLVPTLQLENVTSHIGRIFVHHPRGVRLLLDRMERVRRIVGNGEEYVSPIPAETHPALMFDFWDQDFLLSFLTQLREQEILANNLLVRLDLTPDGMELATIGTLECLYAPLFELRTTLPRDWFVGEILVRGERVRWKEVNGDGLQEIRIPVNPPLQPGDKLPLTLTAVRPVDFTKQEQSIELPRWGFPDAGVVQGTYTITADPVFEVVPQNVSGMEPAFLEIPHERVSYRFDFPDYDAELTVSRRPMDLAVQTLTFLRLEPEQLELHFEAKLEIEGGGTNLLQIAIPASFPEGLRFRIQSENGVSIVEQQSSAPQNQERGWSLRLDRYLIGTAVLGLDLTIPRNPEQPVSVPSIHFPQALRQNGYVALEASGEQRLLVNAKASNGKDLTRIDSADVPVSELGYLPRERIVEAVRYVVPGAKITIGEQRFPQQPVPSAMGMQLELTSVLDQTGEFQHRSRLKFQAVGVQSLRVVLPPSSELWATLIDGEPIEVRLREQDVYLVPLPPAKSLEQVRVLDLFYATEVDRLKVFGTLQQSTPDLAVISGQGIEQPLNILEQEWTIHYPDETTLVSSEGLFHPSLPLESRSLLGSLISDFEGSSLDELGWKLIFVLIFGATLVILAILYRRFGLVQLGWGGIVLCLLGVGILLVAMIVPALQPAREASHRGESAASRQDMGKDSGEKYGRNQDQGPSRKSLDQNTAPSTTRELDFSGEMAEPELPATESTPFPEVEPVPTTPEEPPQVAQQPGDDLLPGRLPERELENGKPQPKPMPNTARQERLARLSVAVEMQPSNEMQSLSFHYAGIGAATDSPALEIRYEHRNIRQYWCMAVVMTVTLLFWGFRRSSGRTRSLLGILGTVIPLALFPIVPHSGHVYLDGIFLGTVLGAGLWLLVGMIDALRSLRGSIRKKACSQSTAMTLLIGLILTGVGFVCAEETPFTQQPDPSFPSQQQAANPEPVPLPRPAYHSPVEKQESVPEIVIVPYQSGTDPLSAKSVFLPREQYLKLYRLAHPEMKFTEPAPVQGVVSSMALSAELSEGTVLVTGRIVMESFVDRQISLPLPLGSVVFETIRLDDAPAPTLIQPDAPDVTRILLNQKGTHLVDVEFRLPGKVAETSGQFLLPVKRVPAGKLTFTLPAAEAIVRVNNATTTYRRVTEGDQTRIEVPIQRDGPVMLSWRPEQTRMGEESTVFAESGHTLLVLDQGLVLHSGYEFQVRQGALKEVQFAIPQDVKVQKISGPDVGGWQRDETAEEKTLTVFLRRDVTDRTDIDLELYHPLEVEEESRDVEFPHVFPQNVPMETGTIGIRVEEQFLVRAGEISGDLRQIDTSSHQALCAVPEQGTQVQLAYRYNSSSYGLPLKIARRGAESQSVAEYRVILTPRQINIGSLFRLTLKGTPRSRLVFQLPLDYVPLEVAAQGMSDWYVHQPSEDDPAELIIELEKSQLGALDVSLTGMIPKSPEDDFLELELPSLMDVNRVEAVAGFWFDESYRAEVLDPFGWKSLPPQQLPQASRFYQDRMADFAFRHPSGENLELISFTWEVAEPMLRADSVALVTVTETFVSHWLALKWKIRQASANSLQFTTPGWLKGKLKFRSENLRKVTHEELPNGDLLWTVQLQKPQRDEVFLIAYATLPPELEQVAAPTIQFVQPAKPDQNGKQPQQKTVPLEFQQHYLVLSNQSDYQLRLTDSSRYEDIAPEQLPIVLKEELVKQFTSVFRLRTGQAVPRWEIDSASLQDQTVATVKSADLTLALYEDGTWRLQASYQVRNRGRQFLPLLFPKNSQLLAVTVQGQASRPVVHREQERMLHLIPLPKTSVADRPFNVTVILAGQLESGSLPVGARLLPKDIDLPAPEVLSIQESPEFGIPVAQTNWTVYLPEGLHAEPVKEPSRTNLTQITQEQEEVQRKLELLSTAEELFDVLEGPGSNRAKYQALNNLKEIQEETLPQGSSRYPTKFSPSSHSEELDQRQVEFQNRLREVESRIQLNESTKSVIILDDSQSLKQLDTPQQQLFLDQQRESLYEFNSSNSPGQTFELPSSGEQLDYGYRLEISPKPMAKPGEQPAPGEQSTPQLPPGKGTFSRRNQQSNEELFELNEKLEQQQQGQQQQTVNPATNQPGFSEDPFAPSIPRIPGMTPPVFNPGNEQQPQSPLPNPPGTPFQNGNQVQWPHELEGPVMPPDGVPTNVTKPRDQQKLPEWTQAGGLSLKFEIPTHGQKLTFTKVGGSPKLALRMYPRQSVKTGFRFAWSLLWLLIGAVAVIAVLLGRVSVRSLKHLPKYLVGVSLLVIFLLPLDSALMGCGIALLVISGMAWGVLWAKGSQRNKTVPTSSD